ncbi:DUF115 domain-containing protein [Anaerocolumna sp. AGMB13025]|uniref:motility associated factor glycosyltransferase family protein n=1 Tax=Anaerocolumna sp. AGMB13025 TaxID=3039116 RepID=UPI00241C66A3|nr:6-hydroxymethylpterin diphosphokinase MptE-like protein [Anaerocolumna sp. AGMB13025]WFR56797.1 DUF115 domain-containing protein [Anaerocolumna sp. AGMB13025]
MEKKNKVLSEETSYYICQISKIIYYFRIQNYDYALRKMTEVLTGLGGFFGKVQQNGTNWSDYGIFTDYNSLNDLLTSLLESQKNKDYILLADIYEAQLLPFLFKIEEVLLYEENVYFDKNKYDEALSVISNKDIPLAADLKALSHPDNLKEKGYDVEYTACGAMTISLYDKGKRIYLHSNCNVYQEAFALANSWYREDKSTYIVYGLGLGYHIEALTNLDNNITIEIFESDLNTIQLACAYSGIGNLLRSANVKLQYDPNFSKLSERLKSVYNDTEFVIHYPSLRSIQNKDSREDLEEYFLQYSSVKNQLHLLNGNFRENTKRYDDSVDALDKDFYGKDVFIVAAGPSLDKNFRLLKNRINSSIILATGTVFRKLIREGIRPDYFIVTDANPRVYAQIQGLEQLDIPMIYLSTAFKGFTENYQGKKYIVLQNGYEKAEEYATVNNMKLFDTGGSVSTTALDVAIKLKSKRIIFLGLDLAFTENYVHASDTSRRELVSTDDLEQVNDINGKSIYTSRSFLIYKKWIENHIRNISDIELINATEGGALIKGMRNVKLQDFLHENYDKSGL